ncbi:MAG: hypothetical protein ACK5NB_09510 [Flavobacteriaceae bacterium]
MNIEFLNNKTLRVVGFLTVLFANFIAIYVDANTWGSVFGAIDSVLFFVLFFILSNEKRKPIFIALFALFVLADLLNLKQGEVCSTIMSGVRIIRHLLVLVYFFSELSGKKLKRLNRETFFFILIVALLNSYLASGVMYLIKDNLFGKVQYVFMSIESVLMLFLGFFAAIYGFAVHTKKANYFMVAMFAFIFSDTFYALAYYIGLPFLFYVDKLLYLFGFIFLLAGTVTAQKKVKPV